MFQFSNGLPVRQTIRFGQSRILCSQNTFFVFATPIKTWGNTVSLNSVCCLVRWWIRQAWKKKTKQNRNARTIKHRLFWGVKSLIYVQKPTVRHKLKKHKMTAQPPYVKHSLWASGCWPRGQANWPKRRSSCWNMTFSNPWISTKFCLIEWRVVIIEEGSSIILTNFEYFYLTSSTKKVVYTHLSCVNIWQIFSFICLVGLNEYYFSAMYLLPLLTCYGSSLIRNNIEWF